MRYSDEDLDAAVAQGALPAEAAASFRAFVARREASAPADEEAFRLLTGFNDIFVAIALVISISALAWLTSGLGPAWPGAAVAAASWALAEFFTRVRRMALPSILLLIAFVGGTFAFAALVLGRWPSNPSSIDIISRFVLAGGVGALAAFLHWRRFKVPITVAAGVVSLGVAALGAIGGVTQSQAVFLPGFLALGLATFALALRWDMSDPLRRTRRADVAFWLHLAAAPMIVHPVFSLLGLSQATPFGVLSRLDHGQTASDTGALAASAGSVAIYLVLGAVALIVDRRALMVSGLLYLIYAANTAFRLTGSPGVSLAAAALIVGAGLLLLSAFWASARRGVLRFVPARWRERLPPAA